LSRRVQIRSEAGLLAAQVADEVVERQAGVDDVLDDQDVLAFDARRQVLEDPDEPDDSVVAPPYDETSMRSIRVAARSLASGRP
jgi:hypothetical protein